MLSFNLILSLLLSGPGFPTYKAKTLHVKYSLSDNITSIQLHFYPNSLMQKKQQQLNSMTRKGKNYASCTSLKRVT